MTALEREVEVEAADALLDLSGLATVTLDNLVRDAALMRRVDRKYLVPASTARGLVQALASTHAVLEIDGRRSTTYRTTYFDTPEFSSTRAHVQRRRQRWKIRQRWYVEDGLCRVEVKTKNGRGETVKTISPSSIDRYGSLGAAESLFVESVLSDTHPELLVGDLVASAELTYSRATLADLVAGTRVTIDWGLVSSLQGGNARLDDEFVLIETKGGAVPAQADRVLNRLGARKRSFSKYAATTSLVRGDIPDNDVRRLRGTSIHVHLEPDEGSS